MTYTAGIDIGGTFTDTVVMDDSGAISTYKTPTTPEALIEALLTNLEAAAAEMGLELGSFMTQLDRIAHGTTAATNAYIERRGAKVALLATRGFEDTMFIQRMLGMTSGLSPTELTDYSKRQIPEPLCPRDLVFGIRERVDYRGEVIEPLQEEDVRRAAEAIRGSDVEAVAVAYLWSFKNPHHEQQTADILQEELPGVYVSTSSELVPRLGEYERTATTVVNAYLGPLVKRYSAALQEQLTAAPLFLLDSSGGVMTPVEAGNAPVRLLLSGPSGGVTASQYLGEALGHRNIITFDMGGTSTDVGMIVDGAPLRRHETESGKYHLLLPVVDVNAIGTGGGSIALVEHGGYLQVGRRSAGAVPGPACYGRGGTQPTVTDADLVLGLLDPENFLGGRLRLDVDAARTAIRDVIAEPLDMSIEEAAAGIKRIADARMADAVRTATIERGFDPRDFVLYAFGGAGPTHAPAFGLDVVDTLLVPASQSVHSALGAIASDVSLVVENTSPRRLKRGEPVPEDAVREMEGILQSLEERADAALASQGVREADRRAERVVEVRFARQNKALSIPLGDSWDDLLAHFLGRYADRYGTAAVPDTAGFEIVTLMVQARGVLSQPALAEHPGAGEDPSAAQLGRRKAYDPTLESFIDTQVYDGTRLEAENRILGPAIVEYPGTTVVLVSGQEGHLNHYLDIEIRRAA
jgi:N-methylhydantoinase A